MSGKSKLYLGYDEHKNIFATDISSLFVIGNKGSGKTRLINHMIFHTLLHNHRGKLAIEYFSTKDGINAGKMGKDAPSLPEFEFTHSSELEEGLVEFLRPIMWTLEDRENVLRLSKCDTIYDYNILSDERQLTELLYIIDGSDCNVKYNSEESNIISNIVTRGGKCGIYLVYVARDLNSIPETTVRKAPKNAVLHCTRDVSMSILGSDIASTVDIDNNHIVIFKDSVPYHSPQFLRVPTLTPRKMQGAVDIFMNL